MRIKFLDSLPVKIKLVALPLITLCSLGFVVSEITSGMQMQRIDATLVNVAGRQRMLNQRYLKEVLHSANAQTSTSTAQTPAHEKTQALFLDSLHALTHGGEVVINPAKGIKKTITAPSNPELIETLKNNLHLANTLYSKAQQYVDPKNKAENVDVQELLELNAQLHTQANKAVQQFVAQSNAKIDHLIKTCIIVSAVSALFAILVSMLISGSINRPVSEIRQKLKHAAEGDLSQSEENPRGDEFGEMSKDLSNTLLAVSNALGSEKVDWQDVSTLFNDMKNDLRSIRAMVTQSPTSMMMLDAQGIVAYMNPQSIEEVRELHGSKAIAHPFKVGDKLADPSFGAQQLCQVTSKQRGGQHRQTQKMGNEYLDISTFSLQDDTQAPMGTLLTWQIVTTAVEQQKHTDLATQEKTKKADALSTLIDNMQITLQHAIDGDLGVDVPLGADEKMNEIAATVNKLLHHIQQDMCSIQQSSANLLQAATTLTANTDELEDSASENHRRSCAISTDTESVGEYMTTAATASEQMSVSIKEIGTNSLQADNVASEAVSLTESATLTVQQLFDSSKDIGNVLKFINSIAEQTNLLALNATIEAARAGDAGKGFAVVANEVKELAKQTADATEEIATRIHSIQQDSSSVVESTNQINEIVSTISSFQGTVSSAITQQTAVSREMCETITMTADSSIHIREHIDDLVSRNRGALDTLQQARSSIDQVRDASNQLDTLLSRYKLAPE